MSSSFDRRRYRWFGLVVLAALVASASPASAQQVDPRRIPVNYLADRGGLNPLIGSSVQMTTGLDGTQISGGVAGMFGRRLVLSLQVAWDIFTPQELVRSPFGSGLGLGVQLTWAPSNTIYVRRAAPPPDQVTDDPSTGTASGDWNYGWFIVARGFVSYRAIEYSTGATLAMDSGAYATGELAVAWNAFPYLLLAARGGYSRAIEAPGALVCAPGTAGDDCSQVHASRLNAADELFLGAEARVLIASVVGFAVRGAYHATVPGLAWQYRQVSIEWSGFVRIADAISLGVSPGLVYDVDTTNASATLSFFVGGNFEVIDVGS